MIFLSQIQNNLNKFINDYNNADSRLNSIEGNEIANKLFPIANPEDGNDNVRHLNNREIYDGITGNLIFTTKGEKRIYPNAKEIPPSCGFGRLHFMRNKWKCVCSAPNFFNGIYCDEPQRQLLIENKCAKVGDINNLENTDITTFNPILGGVCVECSVADATPDLSSSTPKCRSINNIIDDEEEEEEGNRKNKCFADPINLNLNSSFNKYVDGYGCSCDYYNGFVEVNIGGGKEKSNACLKVGKRTSSYHTAHLAYYTLKNNMKPIQIHEYRELEEPYKSIFSKGKTLLVDQPARDIVHKEDWLNRCIKANKRQKIRRLNHPESDWPVVHKRNLINYYRRRSETYPISAYKIATGTGFETKHWYETTNLRYLKNSVWGHPIMYGSDSISRLKNDYQGNQFIGLTTLNPLGAKLHQYYGLTMQNKPGAIVKLDTRGYTSDKNSTKNILTLPPDYKTEMMNQKDFMYIPSMYKSYHVKN